MGFNFVRLVITLRSENSPLLVSTLPFAGSNFAELCRTSSCNYLNRDCPLCSSQHHCAWNCIFGQTLTSDVAALRRYQKPSLPFVFTFPHPDFSDVVGNEFQCELVVIGPAITHLSLLLKGFSELLARSNDSFTSHIVAIACRDFQGQVQASFTYDGADFMPDAPVRDSMLISSSDSVLDSCVWDGTEMVVRLTSPLRLMEDGHLLSRFVFSRFARSVMRRVSSMSYYYGEKELDWDFKELAGLMDKVICSEDNFKYVKEPRKMSGIIGHGRFMGELERLSALLKLGSIVHTGKGAAFGMGCFEIEV